MTGRATGNHVRQKYCAKFIADAERGGVCHLITEGHTCGLPVGHPGPCECDCGVTSTVSLFRRPR